MHKPFQLILLPHWMPIELPGQCSYCEHATTLGMHQVEASFHCRTGPLATWRRAAPSPPDEHILLGLSQDVKAEGLEKCGRTSLSWRGQHGAHLGHVTVELFGQVGERPPCTVMKDGASELDRVLRVCNPLVVTDEGRQTMAMDGAVHCASSSLHSAPVWRATSVRPAVAAWQTASVAPIR